MRAWENEIEKINFNFFDELKDCTHNYFDKTNPYHREHNGNVWGHTQDVYAKARELYPDDGILQLACLLHDIAKPNCRELNHEKERASFFNHEGFGVAKAAEVINKMNGISFDDKIRVFKLIQRHADSYKLGKKKLKSWYTKDELIDIIKIRWADTLGREKEDDDGADVTQIERLSLSIPEYPDSFYHRVEGLPTVTLLVGPPNSGKSTYIKDNQIKNVLSRDDIIMQLGDSDNYNDNWNSVDQKEVDVLFKEKRDEFIKNKMNFTIDMTNMNAKSRHRQTHDIKKYYNMNAVVFIAGYSDLIKRNNNRENKKLGRNVIDSMVKRWQLPLTGEGFDEIKYILN